VGDESCRKNQERQCRQQSRLAVYRIVAVTGVTRQQRTAHGYIHGCSYQQDDVVQILNNHGFFDFF
jgi:hypothetical protein